jgi:hypothetical protein
MRNKMPRPGLEHEAARLRVVDDMETGTVKVQIYEEENLGFRTSHYPRERENERNGISRCR